LDAIIVTAVSVVLAVPNRDGAVGGSMMMGEAQMRISHYLPFFSLPCRTFLA
jgi:hypothetical protein